jgi:hypothetical protein
MRLIKQSSLSVLLLWLVSPTVMATCPNMQDSGGSVVADLKVLSRSQGVSPETVYFSAQDSVDPGCVDYASGQDMEACRTGQYLGYHFNFDDPDAGFFSTSGGSKNQQVSGAPRAAHTYVCEGSDNSRWNELSQSCDYAVKVRVENPDGDWADACHLVSIQPQEAVFPAADTYCVSSDADFTACPAGVPAANRLTDSPGQNPAINRSNSRILYQRGSSGIYAPLCLRYDEHHIRVDAYDVGTDPVISELSLGTAQGCHDHIPTTAQLNSYPLLAKDVQGEVISGWHYANGVSNLRVGELAVGMSATLLTVHRLDMDWSLGGGFSGVVSLNSAGWNCYNNSELDCALISHPYGLFLSEVYSHGNAVDNLLPGVNYGCFNDCGLINSAFLGVYGKTAFEHNLRIMGAWGLVVSDSHLAGNHIGGNGNKSKITLRQVRTDAQASAVTNPEDFVSGNHSGDGPGWQRTADETRHFSPHFNFLINNILGDTDQHPLTEEANWLGLHPGTQYSSVFGTRFLTWPGTDPNSTQMALGGRNITSHDTSFNGTNVTCRFRQRGYPQPSYYFDEDLIYSDAPDGACNGATRDLPSPAEPGIYDLIFANGFESDGL